MRTGACQSQLILIHFHVYWKSSSQDVESFSLYWDVFYMKATFLPICHTHKQI